MTQIRITLVSIIDRPPAEALHWLSSLDPIAWSATEHVLNIVGTKNFVKHWEAYREEEQKIAYDFTEGWPQNAIRKVTGSRWKPSLDFRQVNFPNWRQ
jgi:hypothetical protein